MTRAPGRYFSESQDWRVLHEHCLRYATLLRERDLEFLTSLKCWRGNLTEKQFEWLSAIYGRLRRYGY